MSSEFSRKDREGDFEDPSSPVSLASLIGQGAVAVNSLREDGDLSGYYRIKKGSTVEIYEPVQRGKGEHLNRGYVLRHAYISVA